MLIATSCRGRRRCRLCRQSHGKLVLTSRRCVSRLPTICRRPPVPTSYPQVMGGTCTAVCLSKSAVSWAARRRAEYPWTMRRDRSVTAWRWQEGSCGQRIMDRHRPCPCRAGCTVQCRQNGFDRRRLSEVDPRKCRTSRRWINEVIVMTEWQFGSGPIAHHFIHPSVRCSSILIKPTYLVCLSSQHLRLLRPSEGCIPLLHGKPGYRTETSKTQLRGSVLKQWERAVLSSGKLFCLWAPTSTDLIPISSFDRSEVITA